MYQRLLTQTTYHVMNAIPELVRDILLERLLVYCESKYLGFCFVSLHRLQDAIGFDGLKDLKIGQLLISTLRNSEQAANFRRAFLRKVSESQVSMRILRNYAQVFSTRSESSRCKESKLCCTAISSQQDKLFLELLGCIQSTTNVNGAERPEIFSCYHGLLECFINSLRENTPTFHHCSFFQLKEPERNGFFPQTRMKTVVMEKSDGASYEWRSRVTNLLVDNARTSHETIIQQMEAIIQDFENRCSNVEEPLAAVVREREELNQQLEASRHLNQQLEEQARQSAEMVNALKKQLDESIAQVRDYSFQIVHLTDQVDALQTELDTTRTEARDGMEMVKSKARDRELDLMATVAERDDLLEEQQLEIETVSKERTQLREAVDANAERHQAVSRDYENLRQEMARVQKDASQDCDMLRLEITKMQQVIEIRESTNIEKDNRIITLGETNKDLQNENQMLRDKVSVLSRSIRAF